MELLLHNCFKYNKPMFFCQSGSKTMTKTRSSTATNIIQNHDFSQGLNSWHLNCCDGFIISPDTHCDATSAKTAYAVIANRKESWQGLEQDITTRVSPFLTYTVTAVVGVSGNIQGSSEVQATLKLEYPDSTTSYLFIQRSFSNFPPSNFHESFYLF